MARLRAHRTLTRLGVPTLAFAAGIVLVLGAAGSADAQCALCRAALENSPEGRAMGSSFNFAILLMLAAPYLLTAVFAVVVFHKRLERALSAWWQRLRPHIAAPAHR